MADTGWTSPGTAANVDRDGKTDWSNVDYAKVDNSSCAADTISTDYNDWLRMTNFGFAIPAGATIDGIEVRHKKAGTSGDQIKDSSLRLRKTAGQVGDDKATATWWTAISSTDKVTIPPNA